MPQKFIDQTTIQPDGRPGDDAFTAFATCNDNFEDAEHRLSTLEGGSSNIGQDVADLKTGLQQEQAIRLQADDALGLRIDAEQAARQALAESLGARFIGKNRFINGSLRWWQRGTSFTSPGYTVDRWYFNAGGVASPSLSRNPITPGAFPDVECLYFAKISYGNITDAANHYVVFEHRIENVTTLAGRTATISFKVFNSGAAGRQIAVEVGQSFGSGGSPQVSGIGATKYSLPVGINTINHTVQIPSISGKNVGGNNLLIVTLWATGGSNFNARNASLGAQTGDVHFTQLQIEEGSKATAFEYRPDGFELQLCQRYYEKSYSMPALPGSVASTAGSSGSSIRTGFLLTAPLTQFIVEKRDTPAVTLYAPQSGASGQYSEYNAGSSFVANRACAPTNASTRNFEIVINDGSGVIGNTARFHWTADAEL
ncbi:hypothetical protein [Stenotrophomonas maltophilia]|uniref:hypothetical protein n=1 Tax=Stenotrophomonas maltophilia TaxID=40324 RepID=UPI000C1626F1|nr:hypothetical protein [Stenotrophomonas maltophilia]